MQTADAVNVASSTDPVYEEINQLSHRVAELARDRLAALRGEGPAPADAITRELLERIRAKR